MYLNTFFLQEDSSAAMAMFTEHKEYRIWSLAKQQFLKKENGKQSVKCTGTGDEDSSRSKFFHFAVFDIFGSIYFFIVSKASS